MSKNCTDERPTKEQIQSIQREVAEDFSNTFNETFKYRYPHLGDMRGILYICAIEKMANWNVPDDTLNNIKKAWGKYLSLCFRDVVTKELKGHRAIPKCQRNGETFNPMVDFEDGVVPEWIAMTSETDPTLTHNAKRILSVLQKNLTKVELATIRLRSELHYNKKMTYDDIGEYLGMCKSKVSMVVKSANKKAYKCLKESGLLAELGYIIPTEE